MKAHSCAPSCQISIKGVPVLKEQNIRSAIEISPFRGHPCTRKPNPCQNGGTCSPRLESYECACQRGFSGAHCEKGEMGRVGLDVDPHPLARRGHETSSMTSWWQQDSAPPEILSLWRLLGGIQGKQAGAFAGWHCRGVGAAPFLRNAGITLHGAGQILLPTGRSPSPVTSSWLAVLA